jgi:hypothetical protein
VDFANPLASHGLVTRYSLSMGRLCAGIRASAAGAGTQRGGLPPGGKFSSVASLSVLARSLLVSLVVSLRMATTKTRKGDRTPTKSPVVVRRYVGDWKPERALTEDALAFVRSTTKKLRPQTISEASSLLDTLTDLVRFLDKHGVAVVPRSSFDHVFDDNKLSAWERDLKRRVEAGEIKQSTFNTRLSRLKVSLVHLGGAIEHGDFMMQTGRTRRGPLTSPMPDADFARWLQVALTQTEGLRLRFLVLLLACRGAGLGPSDFKHLRGSDVILRPNGTNVIAVHGRAERIATVLDRYAEPLREAAAWFGDDLVVGTWAHRENPTSDLVNAVRGGHGLARPMPRALRRAYVIEMLHTDIGAPVLREQLGGASLSELEGALPYVDTTGLDRRALRVGRTGDALASKAGEAQ